MALLGGLGGLARAGTAPAQPPCSARPAHAHAAAPSALQHGRRRRCQLHQQQAGTPAALAAAARCCAAASAASASSPQAHQHRLGHSSTAPRSSSSNSSSSSTTSSRRRPAAAPARAASANAAAVSDAAAGEADDFYAILGVRQGASPPEIRRAYLGAMKEFHPDLSGDEESTEFCTLLNEIYETLMDPDRRATYDALVGFSASSINPFVDTSLPADQVFVDEYTCIGCRNCTNVCPSSFAIEDDFGRARVMRQGVDSEAKLQEAIDTCPVNCIHWVTASQLSLLEAAMAKMERVAVWSLMSGGGSGRDVFTEASISWEKRQAEARAKVQQETDQATIWNNWWASMAGGSAGANMYAQAAEASRRAASSGGSTSSGSYDAGDSGSEEEFGSGGSREFNGTKEGARIAKLAAKAARAARQWKSWQELQRRGRSSSLLIASVSVSSGEQE